MCERQLMMLDSLGMDWEIVDPWEEKFKELTIFKDQYGHTDVPGDYGPLGRWVAGQRKDPPEGEKRERLEKIGFEWDGRQSRSRNAWREGVKHAKEYYGIHGDIKIPRGYVCSDGYKLGNSIITTRRNGRLEELKEICEG